MSRTGRSGRTGPKSQEWVMLQRKIFSRWVKQKLLRTRPEMIVNDVVDDYKDGLVLLNLIEVLSESKYEGKINPKPKMSVHRIDNLNNALKFAWNKGVDMKVKPSAEQLEQGDVRAALALTWGIMMKYIKIDDESGGESLNAKDALLMWCKNKTASYKNVGVTDFKKSFADGLALCAIIHKHRPKLIDFNSLNSNDPIKNLQIAQDAAEKYFGLEKYITPDEIRKLDENSMVVYVSEYYYGIAEQRKLDLAARRIKKLINLTKENDRLKSEYNKTAKNFKEVLKKSEKVLEDRTIDNTMEGAKSRLEKFYEYKTKDKNSLIADQLNLESNYNNLAMRLSHHKRPEFKAEIGCSLKDIEKDMLHLEECEQERKVALHNELNRQIKLVNISKQHESRYNKLIDYCKQKQEYLEFREEIGSVSEALLQLRLLESYEKENETMIKTGVANLKKLSEELKQEKYEYQENIEKHDKEIEEKFEKLEELKKIKKPILDDHLKREEFIEKVRQMNDGHKDQFEKLVKWFEDKKAYLEFREEINSVEARNQLSLFDIYSNEYQNTKDTSVAEMNKLGKDILAQKYETELSNYVYNITQYQGKTFGENQFKDITDRHDDMNNKLEELSKLAETKKAILDDHLKREEFIEKVRQMNVEHKDQFEKLVNWFETKKTYLELREEINSVGEGRNQLSLFDIYSNEYQNTKETLVVEMNKLGKDILAQKYETELSNYVYNITQYQGKIFGENQFKDITDRHDDMNNKLEELSKLAEIKKAILDDHLKREEFIEKKTYLEFREEINSVSEAKTQLNLFDTYSNEYKSIKETRVIEMNKFGEETIAQKYETELSNYVYDITQYQGKTFRENKFKDITDRHDDMNNKLEELFKLAIIKKEYLDKCLQLETDKEKVRLAFANSVSEFGAFVKLEIENASLRDFGFTLDEVESFKKVIEDNEKEVLSRAEVMKKECEKAKEEMNSLKVIKNPYTKLTLEDINNSLQSLKNSLNERMKAYEIELQRQKDNDALCKKFADVADPLFKWISEQKDKITESKETLQNQLEFVNKCITGLSTEKSKLEPLQDLQSKMDKAGIQNNRHTTLTLKDLLVQWEQYENFLNRKKKMLEEEIENQKLRGITAEQMQEIEENFKQFDFDNSGTIDRKELTACLYSLGEERTPKEITKIMEEYGDGKDISYERFKEFMIVLFGDSDTKDEVINSFVLINRGFKVAKKDLMELVMDDQDINYIIQTAPQVDDGYDFHSWTEDIFSR
ncbi:alpha-actinin sarcomeric-like protein [Anaeramoeba ignava]|uniref:Alpha-actinin sarcomeric-like protein n=1 Tax=Anaeramoeba ignava TaxID=1746090 RepID=A0A9Q0LSS0_ANAIG|nr:alpha-actinin sarcomeric-like protein [Anaeramoeba ignava]